MVSPGLEAGSRARKKQAPVKQTEIRIGHYCSLPATSRKLGDSPVTKYGTYDTASTQPLGGMRTWCSNPCAALAQTHTRRSTGHAVAGSRSGLVLDAGHRRHGRGKAIHLVLPLFLALSPYSHFSSSPHLDSVYQLCPWEHACNAGDPRSIPGSGRSPGERNGYLLQYSCLENSMDRGASMGYSPQVRKESNTTERLTLSLHFSAMSLETLGIKRLPIHGPKLLIPHLLHHHPQREQGNL